MRRGTTPTITVTVGADLSGMACHLAFQAGKSLIVKTNDDMDISVEGEGDDAVTTLVTKLTQAETLSMRYDSTCEVQLRAVANDGEIAIATTVGKIPVRRILEDGVING